MGLQQQGSGKTAFREYKAIIAQIYRFVRDDFRSGMSYTRGEVLALFQLEYNNFKTRFDEENLPNEELWLDRAAKHMFGQLDKISEREGIPPDERRGEHPADETTDDEPREDEPDEPVEETIVGFPIIPASATALMEAAGYRLRKRILPSIDELENYLADIPDYAIGGIARVYRGTKVIGYRVWVSDS